MNTYVYMSARSLFLLVTLPHYVVYFLSCQAFPWGENLLLYKFNSDPHHYP